MSKGPTTYEAGRERYLLYTMATFAPFALFPEVHPTMRGSPTQEKCAGRPKVAITTIPKGDCVRCRRPKWPDTAGF